MINETLIKRIQEGLNALNTGYNFKIFTALGDYQDAYRVGNKKINTLNGVARFLPATLLPIPSVKMYRQVAEIEFAVDVDTADIDNDGNYKTIKTLVEALTEYSTNNQAIPYYEEIDGVKTQILPMFTLPTNDIVVMESSNCGEVVPISFSVEFIITENIANANSYGLTINGKDINFEQMVITKQRTANQYAYKGSGNTKGKVIQGSIGIDVVMPQFLDEQTDLIISDIVGDTNNTIWTVALTTPTSTGNVTKTYKMTSGNGNITAVKTSNVGINFSLFEIREDASGEQSI